MDPQLDSRPVTPFALLSTQRSGTSWVMERLAEHTKIGAYGELLLKGREGWPPWPAGAEDRPFYATYLSDHGAGGRRLDPHRHLFSYLDYLYAPRRDFWAIGFKLMYGEVKRYPEIVVYLRRRRVHVLHLVRENVLDVALSQMGTATRQRLHAWQGDEKEDLRISVDTDHLLWWLRHLERERWAARFLLRALRLPKLELSYEALVSDESALDPALSFLGLAGASSSDLSSSMVKLAPRSHSEGVANFDEVERILAGTRFEPLLRP